VFSHRYLPRLVAGMDRWNARHPWSHNEFFHSWILRRLPPRRVRALDVGCGRGLLLERLAERFDHAVGTDLDAGMRDEARARLTHQRNVHITDDNLSAVQGPCDVITMVAVLHHLDLDEALRQVRRLLAPGGRFLVVGLARPSSPLDWAWDVTCLLINPAIGFVLHPRVARPQPSTDAPLPVRDPEETLAQIRDAFAEHLPGARVRRRIGFRYTAEWEAADVLRPERVTR
jgi:SAM-dependent methyltransferase